MLGGNLQTATLFIHVLTCYDSRADGLTTPGWQMGDKRQLLSQHPAKQCQPSISCVLPSASAPARNLLEGSVGTEYAGCSGGLKGASVRTAGGVLTPWKDPLLNKLFFAKVSPVHF